MALCGTQGTLDDGATFARLAMVWTARSWPPDSGSYGHRYAVSTLVRRAEPGRHRLATTIFQAEGLFHGQVPGGPCGCGRVLECRRLLRTDSGVGSISRLLPAPACRQDTASRQIRLFQMPHSGNYIKRNCQIKQSLEVLAHTFSLV